MQRSEDMYVKMMKSMYSYPCGGLVPSNYSEALRTLTPTEKNGVERDIEVDMAAIDLFRNCERGIPP